ncbi:MAG: 2-C-methyl-D-erythritol 4-phosphate cytidylyltransferase [Bacteroidales bacterium]|nr:2-C-methyl-D-erythritol 4-phosphate cytidylyltransferase [Bacteroidales bacterium]
MQKTVIIVAGGSGLRMNSETPKQFIEINGLPVLMHTINRFYEFSSNIEVRLVLPQHQFDFWEALCQKHNFTKTHELYSGGKTRFHSVKNGLQSLSPNGLVAIHDGVRPLASIGTIRNCFMAAEEYGAAIPVIDVHETIRKTDGLYSHTVDRRNFRLVQTPQVFDARLLIDAYRQEYNDSFTDDASVFESTGKPVMLVDGNRENIKITTPADLIIASALLSQGL